MAEPEWLQLYKAALPDQRERDLVTAHLTTVEAIQAKVEEVQSQQGIRFTTGSLKASLLAVLLKFFLYFLAVDLICPLPLPSSIVQAQGRA